jgi:hypothetical protein
MRADAVIDVKAGEAKPRGPLREEIQEDGGVDAAREPDRQPRTGADTTRELTVQALFELT